MPILRRPLTGINRSKNSFGIQLGFGNYAEKSKGVQAGVFNYATGSRGMQAGLLDFAEESGGLQVGLVCYSHDGVCLQIGLLTIRGGNSPWYKRITPLIGFRFHKRRGDSESKLENSCFAQNG